MDPALLVNGTNLIVAEVHQSSRTSSDLSFDLELIATRKGSPTEYLLPAGSSWIWLDDGSNQNGPDDGVAWYGHPDYNDLTWSGPAPSKFGYGNDGEVTTVSFGPDSNNKFITTYFRTWFDVEDVSICIVKDARDQG